MGPEGEREKYIETLVRGASERNRFMSLVVAHLEAEGEPREAIIRNLRAVVSELIGTGPGAKEKIIGNEEILDGLRKVYGEKVKKAVRHAKVSGVPSVNKPPEKPKPKKRFGFFRKK